MTIGININLPWGWRRGEGTKSWFSSYYHRWISENKSFEWQTDYFGWTTLFRFELNLIPTGSDHADVGIDLTIFGFMINAKIYDHRHWDNEKGSWKVYDQSSYEKELYDPDGPLRAAYKMVAENLDRKAGLERQAYLETPEGKAEVRAELASWRST